MDGAGRLSSPEQREQLGKGRAEPRRHGEPGQYRQRKQSKHYAEVSQLLRKAIAGFFRRILQPQIPLEYSRDGLPPALPFIGNKVQLEMARIESSGDIGKSVQHRNPGGHEVQASSPPSVVLVDGQRKFKCGRHIEVADFPR